MSGVIWVLVAVAVALLVLALAARLKHGPQVGRSRLFKRRVLSAPEQVMYHLLKKAITPEYQLLSQVAFSAFLEAKGGTRKENFRLLATARQKVADFLVCDHAFGPLCVVELDDASHVRAKDANRDALLEGACIEVVRYNVKSLPTVEQLHSDILRKIGNERNAEISRRSEGKTGAEIGRSTRVDPRM